MITRPLDLASKLRPEPRNFDWLFFVNAGLLVLFFVLFGSRFVLAPGEGQGAARGRAASMPSAAGSFSHRNEGSRIACVLHHHHEIQRTASSP